DRADDAFAHARDDSFLGRASNETIEMGAHGHARFHLRADSILGHAIDGLTAHRRVRRVDHLWIYAGAYCFKYGLSGPFSGQIDRASAIEIERNSGLVRCNQSKNDLTDIAAR